MRQRVVASILKGIINVSDVIPARKRTLAGKEKVVHVSRILPLNAITSPSLRAERLADMFILSVIFFDYDKTDWPLIRSNTRVNQDNKTAYFDFGKAELFMPIRSFGRKVAAKNIQSLKSDVRAVVAKKLEQLRDRCATEEGQSFLRAIIKEVAKADPRASAIEDVDEKIKLIFDKKAATVNVLQDMLLQRIEAYLKAIEGLNEVH